MCNVYNFTFKPSQKSKAAIPSVDPNCCRSHTDIKIIHAGLFHYTLTPCIILLIYCISPSLLETKRPITAASQICSQGQHKQTHQDGKTLLAVASGLSALLVTPFSCYLFGYFEYSEISDFRWEVLEVELQLLNRHSFPSVSHPMAPGVSFSPSPSLRILSHLYLSTYRSVAISLPLSFHLPVSDCASALGQR